MRIQPIIQTPDFGLRVKPMTRYDSPTIKRMIDTVYLENGKTLRISKLYEMGEVTQKLFYLKDEAGKWIKSKLKCYKGRKIIKELNSDNIDRQSGL